jgi:predicted alpha/beta superfamily hydrolase
VLNASQHFNLTSRRNGRTYRIFIAAPQITAPPEGFAIIYTTDGNAMFPLFVANANLLRMNHKAIFVGIGYEGEAPFDIPRRYYDLTPDTPQEVLAASGRGDEKRQTGGQDLFLDFIEQELKPCIEKKYPVNREKQTLFGHSLGGLFALHTLFTRPQMFQNYVAAAPAIWWNNGAILQEQARFLERSKIRPSRINLLITANTDPARQRDTPDRVARSATLPASITVDDVISPLQKATGVKVTHRIFVNESHISMVPSSINSTLQFVLGAVQPP